ncbi:MAG: hypothetical protein AB1717_06435 [Pseudomonadota bacterium]
MNFFLIYKGDYGSSLRGPEMRYISLAKSLHAQGHEVSVAAKNHDKASHPNYIKFVDTKKTLQMIKGFVQSDCIVIHGGGPLIIFMTLIMGFFGKTTILDSYVPHWIELDESMRQSRPSVTLIAKSYFNVLRIVQASLCIDFMIVANRRQLDLTRGFLAPMLRTSEFERVHIIPFGCEPYQERKRSDGIDLLNRLDTKCNKIRREDFLVGWLGGAYGWFNVTNLLQTIAPALEKNSNIKIVFFGIDESKRIQMQSSIHEKLHSALIFMPWVPFSQRFDYWSAFDISLVWGTDSYENDYASRTRNFDCLTLGLPIIQNKDDEWGDRLLIHNAGIVTEPKKLADELLRISQDPVSIQIMRKNMTQLAPEYEWSRFADKLVNLASKPGLGKARRLLGLVAFVIILPPAVLFLTYSLIVSIRKRAPR